MTTIYYTIEKGTLFRWESGTYSPEELERILLEIIADGGEILEVSQK